MDQFRRIITLLLENKISLEQAQQALAELVTREPQLAGECVGLLNQLYTRKHLDPQRYSLLRKSVVEPAAYQNENADMGMAPGGTPKNTGPAQDSAKSRAPTDEVDDDQEDDQDDDSGKTQFRVPKPTSNDDDDGDKTAFRPRQTDMSAQQYGPTQGGSPTGSTSSSLSGLFGGTSGSSWGNTSSWAGGGAGDSPVEVGSVLKERFVLRELIGKGGMGMVYKALDVRQEEASDRNPYVAIKVLNEEFKQHKDSLKALQREARKAQQLAHPNIVNVFDFDRDGTNVFINMELLEGIPLDKLIRKHKGRGLPWKEALPMIRGMSLALDHAHAKGIIHSDFKPGNCFLTDEGIVKVFDFGIARAAKRTGELKGEETKFDAGTLGALTPAYATCEMIDGDEPDKRDDVYALACTIYELLSGRHPYNKLSAADAMEKGLVPKPVANLSRARNKALQRGLSLKRSTRTESAYQLLEELNPKASKQLLRVGLPAAAVLLLAVTGLIVGSITYKKRQIESIGARLSQGQFVEVEEALVDLRELDASDQRELLSEFRNDLTRQYEEEVIRTFAPSSQLYNYPAARQLVQDVEAIFPDSSRVKELKELIEKERQDLQVQKANEYEQFLTDGDILPRDGDDIYNVLAVIAQVDATDELLSDQRLPQALEQAARDAVEAEEFAIAEDYLAAGFELSPDDSALINVRDAMIRARTVIERAEEIAQLQTSLEPLLGRTATLDDFIRGAAQGDMERLLSLQPDNPVVASVRQAAARRAAQAVDTLMAERAWDEARVLLEDLGPMVSVEFAESRLADIEQQTREFESRLAQLNGDIDEVITARQLDSTPDKVAETMLNKLAEAGAPVETVSAARDRIALGFIDAARTARSTSNWDSARALAARASELNATDAVRTVLDEEIEKIRNQETLAAQELRAQQVELLQQRFEERLAGGTFDEATLTATVATLDELQNAYRDDPGVATFVASGTATLQSAVDSRAVEFAEDANWAAADSLLRAAEAALGASTSLTATKENIARLRSEQASAELKAQIATQESEIRQLVENVSMEDNWMAQFSRELEKLDAIDPGNPLSSRAKEEAAGKLIADARAQREDSRWVIAEQQLARARVLAPNLPAIAVEAQLLEAAVAEYDLQAQESRRAAEIKAQRVKFEREVEASRLDNAEQTLAKLTELVGEGDPFVAQTAPQALVDQRLQVAAQMAARLELTNAIKQLERAEKYSPQDERIVSAKRVYQDQIAVYSTVGSNSVDRLRQLQTVLNRLEASMAGYEAFRAAMRDRLRGSIENLADADRAAAERVFDVGKQAFADLSVSWPSVTVAQQPPQETEPPAEPPVITPPPPKVNTTVPKGKTCRAGFAGKGKQNRNSCYDYVDNNESAGPTLVVIEGLAGGTPFAMSRGEITVADFNRYCEGSGQCATKGGNARLPMTNISTSQMDAYAAWLSGVTGFTYALPTLEQWQHAANANGQKLGSNMNCKLNVGGSQNRGLRLESTATGRNEANAWGLRHIVGNAEEVVRQGGGYAAAGGAFSDKAGNCKPSFTRPFNGPNEQAGFRVIRNVQ